MNANPSSPKPGTGQRVFVTVAAGLGVAALAGGAFVLSFDDLRTLALHGGATPRYARLYPAMYDAVVVVVLLSLLLATAAGWWARRVRELLLLLLLGGAAAASVQRSLVGYAVLPMDAVKAGVAVAPWVILLIAIWLWISMFKHARRALADRAGRGTGHGAGSTRPEVPAPDAVAPAAVAPNAPAPVEPVPPPATPAVPTQPLAPPAVPTQPPAGRTGLRPVGPPPLERYASTTATAAKPADGVDDDTGPGDGTDDTGSADPSATAEEPATFEDSPAESATESSTASATGSTAASVAHTSADVVPEVPADSTTDSGPAAAESGAPDATVEAWNAEAARDVEQWAKEAGGYVEPGGGTRETGVPEADPTGSDPRGSDPAGSGSAAGERRKGNPADAFPGTPPSSTFRSSPARPED
jgi:hypothetical protein